MARPPREFAKDATREQVLAYARQLERELAAIDDEHDAIDTVLAQLRSCRDPHCTLCNVCVTRLFIKIKPAPLALPRKYVVAPWRA